MKILAVADIHGSQYRLNLVLKNIEKFSPELVVICGDLTQYGPGELAKNLLDQLPIETLAVTGNIDSSDVKEGIVNSKALFIEQKRIIKNNITYFGINFIDQKFLKNIEKKRLIDRNTVIVTHVPPFGAQDKIFLGMHGGSKDLRDIIIKYKPRLVLCGHIHEDPGYTKIDDTTIVNCSMGKRGEGAIIDLNCDTIVNLIE